MTFSLQTVVDYDVTGVIPVIWITPYTANTVQPASVPQLMEQYRFAGSIRQAQEPGWIPPEVDTVGFSGLDGLIPDDVTELAHDTTQECCIAVGECSSLHPVYQSLEFRGIRAHDATSITDEMVT